MANDIIKQLENSNLPDATNDFEQARATLLQTIEDCKTTIMRLEQLALQSQNARYYEVLNDTRKTLVDANRDLLKLQKQIRDINKEPKEAAPTAQQNKVLLTTSELLKIIKDAGKERDMKVIEHKEKE
jgi:hypothetical protein